MDGRDMKDISKENCTQGGTGEMQTGGRDPTSCSNSDSIRDEHEDSRNKVQQREYLERKEGPSLSTTRVKLDSILTDELPIATDEKSQSQPSSGKPSPKKYYVANTIVASDGEVYQFEPYQLPPPSEIAACFKDWQKGTSSSSTTSSSTTASSSSSSAFPHQHSSSVSVTPSSSSSAASASSQRPSLPSSASTVATKPAIGNKIQREINVIRRRTRADSLSDGANKMVVNSPYTGDLNESLVHASLPSEWMRKTTGPSKENINKNFESGSFVGEKEVEPTAFVGIGNELSKQKLSVTGNRNFNPREFSFSKYLYVEVFGGFTAGAESSQKEKKAVKNIDNFMAVPIGLEKMIGFGFTACLDTFLYTFTILPMRALVAFTLLFLKGITVISKGNMRFHPSYDIHRMHVCDLMRGLLVLIGCFALQLLNMSRVYHYIRGQTTVKLYVLTGMLEVFDRLLSSFGLDAFDALYYQTRQYPTSSTVKEISWSFIIVAGYVAFHSFLYFTQVATLTVATNSTDQAMIAVIILNNFTEIKSSVFKKFDKHNLFQLACADSTERFQLCLYMMIIFMVGLAQAGGATFTETFLSFMTITFKMISCEALADWIKHAFIVKINNLEPTLYTDFVRVLRADVLRSQKDKVVLERSYGIARRLGFPQIPLACVCVRYLNLMMSTPLYSLYMNSLNILQIVLMVLTIFLVLLIVKIIVGVGLIFYAGYLGNAESKEDIMENETKATGANVTIPSDENNMNINNSNKNGNIDSGGNDIDISTIPLANGVHDRNGSGSNVSKERRLKQDSSALKLSDIERYTVLKSRGEKMD